MAKSIDDTVAYYYDSHPTEEDLMGETAVHAALVRYLMAVLSWLFQGQSCALYANLNFYQTPNSHEYPVAPDIAVIKGVVYSDDIPSWRVGKMGPAPHVVFEVASEETWKKDVVDKPGIYARMGVQEYFAYDPHTNPVYRGVMGRRLLGWQLVDGVMQPLPPGPDGRLWSAHLDSFLLPDGKLLRLTDQQGSLRLTEAQAEARARRAETQRANAEAQRAEAQARRAETEARARRAETQRANAEVEARRAETQRANAEAAARRVEAQRVAELVEKLRSLGIDPDHL